MNVLHSNVACFVQICWTIYCIAKSSKCAFTSGDFCLVCNGHLILLSIWPLFLLGYLLRVFHTSWCVLVSYAKNIYELRKISHNALQFKDQCWSHLSFEFPKSCHLCFIAFIFPTPSIANIIKTSLRILLWYLASADVRYVVSIHQQLSFLQSFNFLMFFSLWMDNVSVETNLVLLDFHI